jgi:hypothetical protein
MEQVTGGRKYDRFPKAKARLRQSIFSSGID